MRIKIYCGLAASFTLCCLLITPSQAQDWGIVINGKAMHLNASKDWNESNWGLGFEREFDRQARWVKLAMANSFVDSSDDMSYMAGGGIKRRFRLRSIADELYVDLGVVGFLMTREDVDNNRAFPGLLPVLTVGTKHVALNVSYLGHSWGDQTTHIRRVDPTIDGVVFFQVKFDASLLGFGGRRRESLAVSN